MAEHVFDFLGLPGPIEEQAETFLQLSKSNDFQWTRLYIIDLVNHYRQRVIRKELAAGSLNIYYMPSVAFHASFSLT